MFQESSKQKGVSKNRKGHPKIEKIVSGKAATRKIIKGEAMQELTKYTKITMYQSGMKPK
jgi:hypothetical protein